MDYVFTPRSLEACIAQAPTDDWFSTLSVPENGSWEVLAISRERGTFVFHREDDIHSPRIIIIDTGHGPFGDLPAPSRRVAAQRVHRAALEAQRPPMRLPREWREFHHNNLVAFFATPESYGHFRWVMSIDRDDLAWKMTYWKITSENVGEVFLTDFIPDQARLRALLLDWADVHRNSVAKFEAIPRPSRTEAVQNAIDLEAVTYAAVVRYKTYEQWLDLLSPQQRKFVESPVEHSIKLLGPAGSGKTLALELKLLRELYLARARGETIRILFATHSWAMAEQVDGALHELDYTRDLSGVEILPLIAVAEARLPKERSAIGFSLLGEDSLSGRKLQIEKISEAIEQVRRGDWLAYRARISEGFRARVEAPRGSSENSGLIWDLMNEFASVLSANGILPGVNAERKYTQIQRASWMMPLSNDVEKRFVLKVYTDYVAALKAGRLLTTDQLINDCLNYLETFVWNLNRESEGYDLIFVDELHLFGEQERLVLHYLTRSPNEYPKLFMALDPRQAPGEVFARTLSAESRSTDSGEADKGLGSIDSVRLTRVHRFPSEVLNLIRHLNNSYPALDLGSDWELDLSGVSSSVSDGGVPTVSRSSTRADEARSVLEQAQQVAIGSSGGQRTAIILLDPLLLTEYEAAAVQRGMQVVIVRGRNDVDQLRYTKKSVVLSAAEYVAGLQFDTVFCAGFVEINVARVNVGYQLRRFLSLLYLAVSRSAGHVHIHVNDETGGVPSVLETALAAGLLIQQ